MENLIIGSHVSYKQKEGLVGSVNEALSYGANTFMIYTGAPQNTKRMKVDENLVLKAHELMKNNNIDKENVIVHAPYIINLATPSLEKFNFAVSFLKEEIKRTKNLGFDKIVLHPGSHVGEFEEKAISNIITGLNEVLKDNLGVKICLETMAGKGTEVGKTFEEIKKIIDGVIYKENIGVCLDTCHIHDAGYDLNNFDDVLNEFDKIIGLSYLNVIHINDSKNEISAHKDRHENIGFGKIGFDNLISIIYNEKLINIPKILETPYLTKDENSKEKIIPPYKWEIKMIKNKKFNQNLLNEIRENF